MSVILTYSRYVVKKIFSHFLWYSSHIYSHMFFFTYVRILFDLSMNFHNTLWFAIKSHDKSNSHIILNFSKTSRHFFQNIQTCFSSKFKNILIEYSDIFFDNIFTLYVMHKVCECYGTENLRNLHFHEIDL